MLLCVVVFLLAVGDVFASCVRVCVCVLVVIIVLASALIR